MPVAVAKRFLASFKHPGPLIVAVSGGGDSIALLMALAEAVRGFPAFELIAVTVDHGLRADSAREACWVASVCAERAIAHRITVWTGDKPAHGVQEAARLARYRLLSHEARRVGAVALVTAHTRDDQAETVAMRAARTDNLAEHEDPPPGLAGMADATLFDRSVWIARPFLHLERSGLRRWLTDRRIGWIDDPSNEDRRFERVRMRAGMSGISDPVHSQAAQDARYKRGDALASLLRDKAAVHGGIVAAFEGLDTADDPELASEAVAVLIMVAGGMAHRPPHAMRRRIADFLCEGGAGRTSASRPRRMTASRSVVELRSAGLYLYREARGLFPARIASGETLLWDRRYRIENRSPYAVILAPSGRNAGTGGLPTASHASHFACVPGGVVTRALASEPLIGLEGEPEVGMRFLQDGVDCVGVERYLAAFDLFLPRFDLTLAKSVARLFGCKTYPAVPFGAE